MVVGQVYVVSGYFRGIFFRTWPFIAVFFFFAPYIDSSRPRGSCQLCFTFQPSKLSEKKWGSGYSQPRFKDARSKETPRFKDDFFFRTEGADRRYKYRGIHYQGRNPALRTLFFKKNHVRP